MKQRFLLCKKRDESSTFANLPDRKTASEIGSETFSLLYLKLIASLFSIFSADDFLICESKITSNKTLTFFLQTVTHS